MTSLNLSYADNIKIRNSWSDLLATNHISDQTFVTTLFANLLESDANLKTALKDDLRRQEKLFTEMLRFSMMYLDDIPVLEECLDAFIRENPSILRLGLTYLEPLGAILIKTLRQFLGSDKFHAGLETVWIQLYIFLANSILQNDFSDVESVASKKGTEPALFEDKTQPLNFKAFSSPVPSFSNGSSSSQDSGKISIDLNENEKYRGFRRSINEHSRSKVDVAVPAALSASTSMPSFSSASEATNTFEPVLSPRSERRPSWSKQLDQSLTSSGDREQASFAEKNSVFDPRRKSSHRRNGSDMSLNMDQPERKVSSSSCESPISDVEDQLNLGEDDMNFDAIRELRSPVFDHNSFGIAALAPIAETEDDEDDKSAYSLGHTRSSSDESSSRTSSLSLHNSDYKSSISSGSGHSRIMEKNHRAQIHHEDLSGDSGYLASPYTHTRCSSSVPSLISKTGGQRASVGFMRSSFVLKKEIAELGYNHPENVVSSAIFSRPSPSMHIPTSRSVSSLPITRRTDRSSTNDFKMPPKAFVPTVDSDTSSKQTGTSDSRSVKSDKTSFRKFLRGLFGSSSPTPQVSMASKKISSPIAMTQAPPSSGRQMGTSRTDSIAASSFSSKRVSSSDMRGKPAPVGYASSIYSKPAAIRDDASIMSSTSGRSSMSFFKSKKKNDSKQANKYLVKRVPYKTVFLKDIVS